MLEKLVYNSKGWSSRSASSVRVAAATDLDPIDIMSKQLVLINQKMDNMQLGQAQIKLHGMVKDVNYVHQGGSGYYQHNRSHPNLSYGNPNNALQPPPDLSVSRRVIEEPKSSFKDDLSRALMTKTDSYMVGSNKRIDKVEAVVDKVESVVGSMTTQMKMLEAQMSQIAQVVSSQHKQGQFPGQPNVNPMDCKANNLRSGTSYEGPAMPETRAEPEKEAEKEVEKEEPVRTPEVQPEACTSSKLVEVKVHLPQRLQKQKVDEQFSRFLDIFQEGADQFSSS